MCSTKIVPNAHFYADKVAERVTVGTLIGEIFV